MNLINTRLVKNDVFKAVLLIVEEEESEQVKSKVSGWWKPGNKAEENGSLNVAKIQVCKICDPTREGLKSVSSGSLWHSDVKLQSKQGLPWKEWI